MYNVPHASTSSARITSPMLIIPGYAPISTTLTPDQLDELLPTLRIYIDSAFPSIALLPAVGVSHHGLEQALRWREADIAQQHNGKESDLVEFVEICQALAFLGNGPTSRTLWSLERVLRAAFEDSLTLEECQQLWALRHLPFTEKWIDSMLRRLATEGEYPATTEEMNELFYHGRLETDKELHVIWMEVLSIFKWIFEDKELLQRFKCMQAKSKMEAKRARRRANRMRGRPTVGRFRPVLEPVPE